MKSERIDKDNIKNDLLPSLYISNGNDTIILATEEKEGFLSATVIWEAVDYYGLGQWFDDWNKSVFSLFEGEITLKR